MARGMELLTINRRLELRREGDTTVYRSLIQKLGDDYFAIQVPMVRDVEVPLRIGERIDVSIVAEDGRYVFTTEVLARDRDRIPLYRLAKPKEMRREQLREYVRWRVTLDVWYEPVEGPEPPEPATVQWRHRGISLDLSGGGLLLLTRRPYAPGTLLALKFEIAGRQGPEVITALGRVRRLVPREEEEAWRFALGISFERISERDREKIIGFIFRRMAAERQRGLDGDDALA